MSSSDINKIGSEEDKKTHDKHIEEEEKEVMLSKENGEENIQNDEGPVKSALSGDITEQGREVKPKFIPIGAIKMPGFFTKNSDKDKTKDEEAIEKQIDNEKGVDKAGEDAKKGLGFLKSFPFPKLFKKGTTEENGIKNSFGKFKMPLPKLFQKRSASTAEAALASMETLEDKVDGTNDGMENVKLEISDEEEGKVSIKLPFKERFRRMKLTKDDKIVCGVTILTFLVLIVIGFVLGSLEPVQRTLRLGRYITTQTTCGNVEGILDNGVFKFFGIPYAVPPTGEKRFANAQPLNNISMCWNGTLQVYEPRPLCLQLLENRNITGEEDCLTLDIITPHTLSSYDDPLPVVVLIGTNTLAGGISPAQPSVEYSKLKEVIFVRPNFRLGSFGFLALDILSNSKYPHFSGNYAISDLIAALQWIKYNIKHFGGDSESVTLLGHRAGASLTAALTTVKKAQNYYSRVWLSSPSVIFPGVPLKVSEKNNEQFKQISKCNDIDCLRRMSSTEVLSSTPDTWLENDIHTLPTSEKSDRSWLVLDGDFLREHAYESWEIMKEAKSKGKEKVFKPIVFGTTKHSGHSEFLRNKHINWNAETIQRMVNESYLGERNLTNAVFQHFNKTYDGVVELVSYIRTLCPLVSLARMRLASPLYIASGGGVETGITDITSDIKAILGTLNAKTPEQASYITSMQNMFYYFVSHGRLPPVLDSYGLIEVSDQPRPQQGLPACDFLIQEDVVPRHAHVD